MKTKEYNYEYFECAGLKWMRTNLGASTETEYGRYYLWGDVKGYKDAIVLKFSDSEPSFNMLDDKSFDDLKGMGAIDDDGILTPKYDAVTQALGNGWRMPTKDEFQSLIDNTTYSWENNFKESGVNGGKFTLKDDSDYLFIPASGESNIDTIYNVGSYGIVWSSTVDSFCNFYSNGLYLRRGGVDTIVDNRYYGLSVRGVKTA